VAKRNRNRRRPPKARSIENPNVPLSLDSDEAFEAFGAERTPSGVRVTPKKALGYPAVWRAVSLISGDVGKLPLRVYRLDGKNKEADPKHPAYRLLLRKPNDAMTAFVFKQTLQAHVLLYGNGYAYIDRDGAGRPLALLILNPESTQPVRYEGKLWYLYRTPQGEQRKLPPEEVLHVKGLGFDGLQGYPVLKIARDAIGAAIAARDHSARYFKNGAQPGGVLQHPGKLTDPARRNMRESWERIHQGLTNAHKIAILEEGTTFVGFPSKARDAQLLETRQFDAREVANIFGVPTHKLGDSSKVAYNSLGEENQSYYDDTLSRWLQVWAEECHDKLLSEAEKASESHTTDFDYLEIQRANLPTQIDYATKGVGNGVLNQDEGRAVFGLNPIPDGRGQRFFIPSTLVPIDQPKAPAPGPAPTPTPTPAPEPARSVPAGLRAVVADVAGRMVRRLATHAEKANRGDLGAWLDTGIKDHSPVMAEAFRPVVLALRDWGREPPEPEAVAEWVLSRFIERVKAGPSFDPAKVAELTVHHLAG
jgi:HK97 family phage portal protein